MELEPVKSEDFTSFTPGVVATHVKIEQLLTQIGGGGTEGSNFKNQVLNKAGWNHDSLVGYAKHPDAAADAFNKIRDVITQTQEKEELLSQLS